MLIRQRLIELLIGLLILSIAGGCSQTIPKLGEYTSSNTTPAPEQDSVQGWWYFSFYMDWPESEVPAWYLDGLLADQVVRPVITAFQPQLKLWRFHRRASRDKAGHRFSFIFYSDQATAETINQKLAQDSSLDQLMRQGFVERISYESTQEVLRPNIAGTSDPNWPEVIQTSWPSYIMGVSQMWLDMVHQIAEDQANDGEKDLTRVYQKTDEAMVQLWRFQSQHAFFHHLNALFGYQEMLYIERKPMRF